MSLKNSRIVDGISLAFIILWTYAALSKLFHFESFVYQLNQSPLLGGYGKYMAILIPGIELIISLLFVFERSRRIALKASFLLITIFTVYLIGMITFADKVPCSCGGIISRFTWDQHIVFNLFFIAIGLIALLANKSKKVTQN
ncbi:hypothetical protein COR50_18400 [Chitinophaga caeni]|uniref:Methylamine utilisation protein MauE domain-containing protein n=1 Tax=Chitinophaga caeni TaxID=2029983 RepID=A0A291QYN2_9BACT|nr:hypothetical protein COR50_18400 [Chitinophaga caeni]